MTWAIVTDTVVGLPRTQATSTAPCWARTDELRFV